MESYLKKTLENYKKIIDNYSHSQKCLDLLFIVIVKEYSLISSRFSTTDNIDKSIGECLSIGEIFPERFRKFRNNLVHGKYFKYDEDKVTIDYSSINSDLKYLYKTLIAVIKIYT